MMNINRQTRLAIQILAECTRHPRSLAQTAEAARAVGATSMQAAGIVHTLMRSGLLETRRGRRGGILLARPAETISVGDVLRVCEMDMEDLSAGALHNLIDATLSEAVTIFMRRLDATTIADVAHGKSAHAQEPCVRLDARTGLRIACPYASGLLQPAIAALPI